MPNIQLVTRADDAGLTQSVNRAIGETITAGVTRNVSVMAPAPALRDAVRYLAGNPDVCIGMHATLSSEWQELRWGPILPPEQVPSLVDRQGYFLPSPADLHRRGAPVAEEVAAELRAQLATLRECGLTVSYVDEHMGTGWVGGVGAAIAELAAEEGLIDADRTVAPLPGPLGRESSPDELYRRLRSLDAGAYVLITHPGFADEELARLHGVGFENGGVGDARAADRQLLLDPRLRQSDHRSVHRLVRYTDL